jgi:hypothetical protein
MRTGETIVFLGPSLDRQVAERLLPGARFLPPAAVGDVHAAARRPSVARIALVDGYFERMAAVWHKEILFALSRGVVVAGAASMGALRAAELADFGMHGVGKIFADFRSGRLSADDEVAVAHLPAEHGHAAVTDALVNLRATLAAAARRGELAPRTHQALLGLARGTFYRERRLADLVEAGRAAGLPRRQLDALAVRPVVDAKGADARALLRWLARRPSTRTAPPAWTMSRTWFWRRFEAIAATRR